MKKIILLVFATILFAFSAQARGIKIPIGDRNVIKVVYQLPDTEDFTTDEGDHVDLAVMYGEWTIAYILPLYITREPQLVLYDKSSDTAYEIADEAPIRAALQAGGGKELEKYNKVPFYHRWGGKAIALIVILLIVWGFFIKDEPEVKETKV